MAKPEPICQFSDRISTSTNTSNGANQAIDHSHNLHSHDGDLTMHAHGGGPGVGMGDVHGHTHEHLEHAGEFGGYSRRRVLGRNRECVKSFQWGYGDV